MKMKNKSLLVVSALIVLLFSTSLALAKDAWAPDPSNRNVPGELIVGFYPNATLDQINMAVSNIGGKIIAKHNAPKTRVVRIKLPFTESSTLDEAMDKLNSNPAFTNVIRYVEPNVIKKAHGARDPSGGASIFSQSSDPLLWSQWGYYDISANLISAPTTTTGFTVAVIDTGVDYNHPDLIGKVTKGYDYSNADNDPMDDHGHGTHVSGIIAAKANNNYGIVGVSWNTKILALKALDSEGYGNDYDISLAIYAAANNASVKVINMSLGGDYSSTEEDAVYYAVVTKGKLLVASAGNSNTDTPSYPAGLSVTYPGRVLAVAAHGIDHCRCVWGPTSGSNYGTWVSITAPGDNILSTIPPYIDSSNSGFASWSGTSMAAPHVAGAAALAWQKYPTNTNLQIANLITTRNSSIYEPLNKDGSCWPIDGSTFERLDVLHILEQQFYEYTDNKGEIYGFAFDAETGLPLVGAKVTAKQGATTTGIDYVPYYGEITTFGDDFVINSGYGLFNAIANIGDSKLTITKTKYMTFSPKDQSGLPETIAVANDWAYAGNIPVPPAMPYYWLVVTWDYGYTSTVFDLYTSVYQNSSHLGDVYYGYLGDLNTSPYMKLLWDSYYYWDNGIEDLRGYAETIRIKKIVPGWRYLFVVDDADVPGSSSNWGSSGMKAYLYKGNAKVGYKLLKTYTPPTGTGSYWYICNILGNTITDENYLTDSWPTP
jgi:thermitase